MKRPRRLWVVEMDVSCLFLKAQSPIWEPTSGSSVNRALGRETLKYWRRNNPDDGFRLTPYIPATGRGK